MKTEHVLLCTGLMALMSCGPSAEEKAKMEAMGNVSATSIASPDSVTSSLISSSAAIDNQKDTVRKFIRTANLKFKVKSVITSTYNIEDITRRMEGFVIYTNLTSHVDYTNTVNISPDSSLETTYYTVNNEIILRIPKAQLDSTLKLIAKNIEFLDYRIIKADDVALDLLSNNMAQKRYNRSEERITNAIDNKGKKLNETTTAEEIVYDKQQQADHAKIENMRLTDQINFSTINLSIYQRQTIKRELIANDKNIAAYEPGLGSRIAQAFKYGWEMLEAFVILIVRLWGLFLLALVIFLLYRKYKHK